MREQEGQVPLIRKEKGLDRVKNFAEGIIDHPLVGLLWLHLNYLPMSGIFLGIGSQINGSYEEIRYVRARIVLNTFGLSGLKALKEHYWPGLDIKKMRELVGPLKSNKKTSEVLKTFNEPIPLDSRDRLRLLRSGVPEKNLIESGKRDLAIIPIFSKEETLAIQRRIGGWKKVHEVFLSPRKREKFSTGKEKALVTEVFNKEIDNFYGRRIKPHISLEEFDHFLWILKLTFSVERAPDQLLRLVDSFSSAILNLSDFLISERREFLYKGNYNEKEISERITDMAWGLLHLSLRNDLPAISSSSLSQIKKINEIFKSGKKIPKACETALEIFSLGKQFPPVSQNFLKEELRCGYYEDIYKIKSNIGEEDIILEFNRDIVFPVKWKTLKWIALRFPFSAEVEIKQDEGVSLVINSLKIREWMMLGDKTIPPIKEFYSYKGRTSPGARKHLLAA